MKINNISPSINFGKVIAINKGSEVERHHQATLSKCATILNGGQAEKEEKFYTKEDKEFFIGYMRQGLSKLPCANEENMKELEDIFLKMYANPVENKSC